jgi:hypothetical protein
VITGASVVYAGGGGGGISAGTASLGGSGGGGNGASGGISTIGQSNGGSGVVILSYPKEYSITIGQGLTAVTELLGNSRITRVTAGAGTISWAA